jgi:tape measure domain-containing protein
MGADERLYGSSQRLKLMAASQGTSLQGEGARKIFSAVATASTALQLSADETSGALYAIGQMMSKGTVQAEELRGQLGERLPGAFQVAARAMGVTTQGLGKMLEQGQVFSEDFLPKFAAALNEQYAGSVEKASKSTSAQIERMKTAIFQAKVAIGEAFGSSTLEVLKTVTDTFKKLQDVMESPEADRALKELASSFSTLVKQIGNDLPGALNNTVTTISTLINLFNSLPSGAVGAAGAGIVGRMVFGGSAGAIIASVVMLNSMLDTLNKRTETHLQRLQSLQSNIRNMMDVVMGKKDWNTGASKTGEVTVPEAAPLDPSNLNFILEQLGNTEAVAEASKIINQKALDEVKKADAEYFKRWQEKNAFEDKMNADRLEKIRATLANEEKLRKQGEDLTLEGDEREFKRLQEVWAFEDKADQRELERIRKQIAQAEEWRKYQDSAPQRAVDEATKKVDFYKERIGFEEELLAAQKERIEAVRKLEIAAQMDVAKANQKAADETAKIDRATFDLKARQIQAGLGDMASMFQSLAGMYDKNSSEAARMQEAANAMIVLQKAVALVNAVGAVASAANAPFPLNFANMAAMAAAMASLLSSIGISFGGGGSGASGPAFGQNTTVLGGANNQGSESIGNTWKLLEDTYDLQKVTLTGIYDNMKQLNANITGIVRGIVSGDMGNMTTGQVGSTYGSGISSGVGSAALGAGIMLAMASGPGGWIGLGAMILDKILGTGIGAKIGDFIFGGSETTATGSGIMVGGGGVRPYSQTHTESSGMFGGFFGGGGGSDSRSVGAIDATLTNLFYGEHGVYTTLKSSVSLMATMLGGDVATAQNKVFEAFELNFIGKTAEEISTMVSEKISAIGDNFAREVFGGLIDTYQEVGEGALETISRLYIDLLSVTEILKMTGKGITSIVPNAIAASESLIELAGGLDKLSEAASSYYDKFYTDAEKTVNIQKALAGNLGVVPGSRSAYRDMVEAINLDTEAGQERYILMMKLAESADEYYSALEEGQQKLNDAQSDIVDIFKGYVDKLKSARESMQMEGSAFARQQETSAQLAFDVVLSQAKLGDFSGIGSLDRSLSTMIGAANSTAGFSTRQEYEANYWKTYNAIAELESLTGTQLSIEERTLNTLQSQLDVLKSIDANLSASGTPASTQVAQIQAQTIQSVVTSTGPNILDMIAAPASVYAGSLQGHLANGGWYAEGGIASGPDSGYGATLHGTELVVSPRSSYPATVRGGADTAELAREIKALREEMKVNLYSIAKNTGKMSKVIDRFDQDGLPPDRDGIIAKWDTAGIPATRP